MSEAKIYQCVAGHPHRGHAHHCPACMAEARSMVRFMHASSAAAGDADRMRELAKLYLLLSDGLSLDGRLGIAVTGAPRFETDIERKVRELEENR